MSKTSDLPVRLTPDGTERVPVLADGALQQVDIEPLITAAVPPVSPANILAIAPDLSLANAPQFVTSLGRLKRVGQCHWKACDENAPRLFTNDSGAIDGILFDPAETYTGAADFSEPPADNSAPQYGTPAFNSVQTAQQVGEHSRPDIFGGTGGLIRWDTGDAGDASLIFTNMPFSVQAGDVVRAYAMIALHNPPDAQVDGQIRFSRLSGAGGLPIGRITFNVDRSVSKKETEPQTTVDLFDTHADGTRFYVVSFEAEASDTADFAVQLTFPQDIVASVMVWHSVNPTSIDAVIVPPLAPGSYAADAIAIGATEPISAEWRNLRVGKTRVADGTLAPPQSLGSPAMRIETKIALERSPEAVNKDYHLPGPRLRRLFPNTQTKLDLILGPGYWPVRTRFSNITGFNIRSAYTDPARWAQLRRFYVTSVNLTDVSYIGEIALWMRTIPSSTTNEGAAYADPMLGFEFPPELATFGKILTVGADAGWSQWLTPPGTPALPEGQSRWAGTNTFVPDTSGAPYSGGDMVGDLLKGRHCRLSMRVAAGKPANRYRMVLNGFASERTSADHIIYSGTTGFDIGHICCYEIEAALAQAYQSKYEIRIDTGSGFVPLSASPLTEADLPRFQEFEFYGTHTDGEPDAPQGNPNRTLIIDEFRYFSQMGLSSDLPGFQYLVGQRRQLDPQDEETGLADFAVEANSVWVNRLGRASPENPTIMIIHDPIDEYPNGAGGAGAHTDNFQGLGDYDNCTWSCQNLLVISPGQGFHTHFDKMLTEAFNVRGLMANTSLRTLELFATGTNSTYVFEGMLLPYADDAVTIPSFDQFGPSVHVYPDTTFDLSNAFIGTNSNDPDGFADTSGTIIGTPTIIGTGRIDNNLVISARADQPSIASGLYIDNFFSKDQLKRDRLAADPDTIRMSAAGQALLGFDFNGMVDLIRAGAWGYFKDLEPLCELGHPTHWASVASTAADNAAITVNDADGTPVSLAGETITEGDPEHIFRIEAGQLMVNPAQSDTSLAEFADDTVGLVTSTGKRINLQVTA